MPFPDGTTEDDGVVPPEEPPFLASDFVPDPTAPTSTGPATSSTAPSTEGTTSGASGSDGEEADDLPEFDPRHREDFSGLLYLGALTDEFFWSAHRFKIKTLTVGELLEVGLIVKEYQGTLGDSKAYVTAFVAASIVSVDGMPIASPLGPQESDLSANYAYIRDSWYPWVIDAVYERCLVLEARVNEIIDAMGKARPRSPSMAG